MRLYTDGCEVDSGTGLMGPCSPPFAVWNFNICIKVQLSRIAGEYTLSSNLAKFQWGSLGPLVVNAGATLHVEYSLYVRNFSALSVFSEF